MREDISCMLPLISPIRKCLNFNEPIRMSVKSHLKDIIEND